MSKKDNVTVQNEEMKMTKYDQKMQKRKDAQKKAKKQQRIERTIWAVVIVAFIAFIASFPIRSYLTVNEVVVSVNGEDISRVEFDYHYYVSKNNFISNYGTTMSSLGMDLGDGLDTQMYSETLTFKDYFEKEAVSGIINTKALKAEAEKAGFVYDVSQQYEDYKKTIKAHAEEMGMNEKAYVQEIYGSHATMNRISKYIKESFYITAYLEEMQEQNAPSDEEIQNYYEENKNLYDSVDYYAVVVNAEISTDSETEPTEEEIAEAMANAKLVAESEVDTVTTLGELSENVIYAQTRALYRDWLFDEARKEGDTTVIEDTVNNAYYVLSFVKRYLDETPTVNARVILNADAQAILDEWKNGEATEESFAALADKHNDVTIISQAGGWCEAITPSGTTEEFATWLFEGNRAEGDTTVITTADGKTYALYYVGDNEPEWKMAVKAEIVEDVLETYIAEISADYSVNGNLEYMEKEAAAEAEAENTEDTTAE